jgi:hypothetical protein
MITNGFALEKIILSFKFINFQSHLILLNNILNSIENENFFENKIDPSILITFVFSRVMLQVV